MIPSRQVVFREQERSLLCDECREPTRLVCRRCGLPLCSVHTPARGRRCGACEALFTELEARPRAVSVDSVATRVGAGLSFALSSIVIWAGALGVADMGGWLLGGWGMLLGFFGGFGATSYCFKRIHDWAFSIKRVEKRARRRIRRRFLREHHQPARSQLVAAPSSASEKDSELR